MFSHLQKLPLAYFQHTKTGDLMSRLTNDVQAVRELMGFGSLAIVDALVVIVFSLTLMITIDPWLTLWSMLAMPFITLVVRFSAATFRLVAGYPTAVERDEHVRPGKPFRHAGVVRRMHKNKTSFRAFNAISLDTTAARRCGSRPCWGMFWPLMQVFGGLRGDGRAVAGRPTGIAGNHEPR